MLEISYSLYRSGLSWYENDSLRCSVVSQSVNMQRRWLFVATFPSSSRADPVQNSGLVRLRASTGKLREGLIIGYDFSVTGIPRPLCRCILFVCKQNRIFSDTICVQVSWWLVPERDIHDPSPPTRGRWNEWWGFTLLHARRGTTWTAPTLVASTCLCGSFTKRAKKFQGTFNQKNKKSCKASYLACTRQKKWRKRRGASRDARSSYLFQFLRKERRWKNKEIGDRNGNLVVSFSRLAYAVWSMTKDMMERDRDARHLL